MKIYIPDTNYECVIVLDSQTIRAYKTTPTTDTTVNYTDYYINSHYISKDGQQLFTVTDTIPTCIQTENLTTNFYYRNDLAHILVIFTVFCIFMFIIPLKIILRLFKRFQ